MSDITNINKVRINDALRIDSTRCVLSFATGTDSLFLSFSYNYIDDIDIQILIIYYFIASNINERTKGRNIDEAESEMGAERYIRSGGGQEKGIKAEDVIYLVSDFETGEKIEATGFEPNAEYNGWTWTVVRGSSGKWCVVDCGY